MHVMAAKDGVLIRRRLRIFAAAVALVLLCAVCVGGVSGDTWYIPNENGLKLAQVVTNAAGSGDTIIIAEEEYLVQKRIILSDDKKLTITNYPGMDVIIKSGFHINSDNVDDCTLFILNSGELTLTGNSAGGSLTVTTNYNGRAFDVNYDDRNTGYIIGSYNNGDGKSAHLIMKDGVFIIECGFSDTLCAANDGGAVLVRQNGVFTLDGAVLAENHAGAGGAVFVGESKTQGSNRGRGTFIMESGLITHNKALNAPNGESWEWGGYMGFGGGVWAKYADDFRLYGGTINGNDATSEIDTDHNEIYCMNGNPPSPPYLVELVSNGVKYQTIYAAYNAAENTDTIRIHGDISQSYIDTYDPTLNKLTFTLEQIDVKKEITIIPSSTNNVQLDVIDNMFTVSSGSLIIKGDNGHKLTVSGINTKYQGNGGVVYVNGGSFTLGNDAIITKVKAENGGAVYLESGDCTLSGSSSITGCTASGNGGAIYVAGGTLTVDGSASVDAFNDVYLSEGRLITANSGYAGNVGKITLPSYADGTVVVDTGSGSDASQYENKFTLNQDGNEGIDRLLIPKEDDSQYLVVKNDVRYEVIIPPTLPIYEDIKIGWASISVSNLRIPSNSAIRVYLDDCDFELEHQLNSDATLSYVLVNGDGTDLYPNSLVGQFTMADHDPLELTATVYGQASYAGQYTDTVTFTWELGTIA